MYTQSLGLCLGRMWLPQGELAKDQPGDFPVLRASGYGWSPRHIYMNTWRIMSKFSFENGTNGPTHPEVNSFSYDQLV